MSSPTTAHTKSLRIPRPILLLPLLAAILFAADAAAQEEPDEPPPLWEGEAELSFVSTTGNTSTRTIGTGFEVEHRPGPWELTAASSFVRTRAEGVVNAESLTGLFRAARSLAPRVQGYGEVDYLRNRFAGIEHRISPEAGVTFRVIDLERHSLRTTTAAGYVRESRIEETRSFASGSAGLRYRWQVSPTAEFTNEGSFTANLEETEDWRVANRAALRVSITDIFSIRVSHTVEHLNDPVPGFQGTDTRMSLALVAGF